MSHITPPEDSPYYHDDKKNQEGGVAIVEVGHPDDDLATTHFGEHGIRRDLVSERQRAGRRSARSGATARPR